MNNLILTTNNEWITVDGENEETLFLLKFRPHLQGFIYTATYNTRLVILWDYKPEPGSYLPAATDLNLMKKVENSLINVLETDLQAILAFVYTGKNQREWHWYSNDTKQTEKRLHQVIKELGKLPINIISEHDPDWSEYHAVLEGTAESASKKMLLK
ncbi:DUF695 domain-containing protein [Mucilaginibacter sp. SP1R1]|uniref:DUF695 domain-containing protein n=1 Tax=Mucilaginibacter sp. SP1R1 TaxID=2723091 RepID=UPI001610AD05|nr:DUF695 domain-containing protein [Mucilaginibacter sp. SP1R1]MBB6152068.1 hypothetical protein [Mucilaginibacter sp. SP1R1]